MQGTKEKGVLDVEHQGRPSSCLGFLATMVDKLYNRDGRC